MEFSLLETMRLDEGAIVRLERHLARLAQSARHFAFAYDEARTRTAVAATAAAHPYGAWRVRLLVDREGVPTLECTPYAADGRGWRVTFATSGSEVSFHAFKFGPPSEVRCESGIGYRLALAPLELPKARAPYLLCAIPYDAAQNAGPLLQRLLS